MIIIYRGLGFVVLLFVTIPVVTGNAIQLHLHFNDHILNVVIVAIFALCCILFDEIDRYDSTFFFINVKTWGYLSVLVPLGFYAWHIYQDRLGFNGIKAELAEFVHPVTSKAAEAAATTAAASPAPEQKASTSPPQAAARDDQAATASVSAEPAAPVAAPPITGMQDKFQAMFPNSPVSIATTPPPPVQDAAIAAPIAPSAEPVAPPPPSPPPPEPKSAVPRTPAFSWSPQSEYDAITKVDKKWLLGDTLLADGTAVQAKMEAGDFGIDITITVDPDDNNQKKFVYDSDPNNDGQVVTSFRVKTDDAEPRMAHSYMPRAHIIENQIIVSFADFRLLKNALLDHNGSVNFGNTRAGQGVGKIFQTILEADHLLQYNVLKAAAGGGLNQLARAGSVIVELPLADRSDNFVEIDPNDAYVRTFVQERAQQLGTITPPPATTTTPTTNNATTDNQPMPDWCPRAKKPAEIMICSTPQLIADENKMEDSYHQLIAASGLSPDLKTTVRRWMAARDSCGSIGSEAVAIKCIHESYGRLMDQLAQFSR